MKLCFVVMGYGKKTEYESGRTLDLNATYETIIEPAVTSRGLRCVRAWGFHAHLDTQSTLTWTLIPRPLGHSFHGHLDTDSTSTWTVMFH